jgi:hypothetical protein
MPAAKAAGKAAMGKRLIQMIVHITVAGVVANPGLPVHMRDVGVALFVAEVAIRLGCVGGARGGLRPASGNRLVRSATCGTGLPSLIVTLGKRRHCENKQCDESKFD